ncbi:hypothetical protein [Embleya sp. AB8]|uniref:hypothetical protein n=1 Tax=Embleya sp. AB8 TaxID=3156304 RepID=UPI003C788DAA
MAGHEIPDTPIYRALIPEYFLADPNATAPAVSKPLLAPPPPPPGDRSPGNPGGPGGASGRTHVEADELTRLAGTADGFHGEIMKVNQDADATAQAAAGGLEGHAMQAALRELAHDWPLQVASAAKEFTLAATALRDNADLYRRTEAGNAELFKSPGGCS